MWAKRAQRTLLMVAADRWLRVDLGRDGALLGEHSVEVVAGKSLVDAVRELCTHGARPAKHVALVCESLWTQTVDFPVAAIQGLTSAQVEHALSREVEPSSAIPAGDAAIGWTRLADPSIGRARLWLTEMRATERDRLVATVAQFGARLERIVHPLGLAAAQARARVEIFDQATLVAVDASMRVIGARPSQRSWEPSVREGLAQAPDASIDWRGRARPPTFEGAHDIQDRGTWNFDEQGATWLAACAERCFAADATIPILSSPPAPRGDWIPLAAGIVLTTATVAWATHDYGSLKRSVALRELEALNAEQAATQIRALEKENATLRTQTNERRNTLDARTARALQVESEWAAQKQRIRALAEALGHDRPKGLAVLHVASAAQGTIAITGVGLDAASIDGYVADLAPPLRDARWDLRPARSSEQVSENGRTFFQFNLAAAPLPADPAAIATRRVVEAAAPSRAKTHPPRPKRED